MRVPNRARGTHQQAPDKPAANGVKPPRDDDQAPIRIVGGRQPSPFFQVPTWLLFVGATPQARALYDILVAHLNLNNDGDPTVNPSRETLAELMGMAQARSVDPYINELEKLGAVDVVRHKPVGKLRARNTYIVHHEPPDGYIGPRSMKEFYRLRDSVSAGGDVVRSSALRSDQGKHPEPYSTKRAKVDKKTISAGRDDVRSSALQADQGKHAKRQVETMCAPAHYVMRSTAHEVELGVTPTPPTPHVTQAGAAAGPEREGGEVSRTQEPLVAEVRSIRPEWSAASIRNVLSKPAVQERDNPELIRAALLLVARDPSSHAPGRLAHDGPWWSRAAAELQRQTLTPASAYGPRCDDPQHDSLDPNSRLLVNPETLTARKCPACHPDLAPAPGRDQR
ncbi:hypothetical protein [Streptosporangium jomthongense]|uniref:Helix-turn-helix domain-containing protein n=1 Tax=Streptosporangium jomthongense TaxID=1193683 RepID=A0ABV8FD93_9ACTN